MTNVRLITDFSKENMNAVTDMLTTCFARNPMVGELFFRNKIKKIRAFMEFCTEYYAKIGKIYGCYNDSDTLVAVSLWNEPNTKPLDLGNAVKNDMLLLILKKLPRIGVMALIRMLKASNFLDSNHITEPHYYLFMLASIEKGAGKVLLSRNIADLHTQGTIYWESSVGKDNHAYYKAFGATPVNEVVYKGVSTMFFIIKPEDTLPTATC